MGVLIDGKKLAEKLCEEVKNEAAAMSRRPCLAAVLVGNDPASQIYVRNKERDCLKCGIDSRRYDLAATTSEAELLRLIAALNADDGVDGILVQLPLPEQVSERAVINAIAPEKDVDAFHPINAAGGYSHRRGRLAEAYSRRHGKRRRSRYRRRHEP